MLNVTYQTVHVEDGKMCVGVALGDEQLVRRLVLVDVVGQVDLLLHTVTRLGGVQVLPHTAAFRRGVNRGKLKRCKIHQDEVACAVFVELSNGSVGGLFKAGIINGGIRYRIGCKHSRCNRRW